MFAVKQQFYRHFLATRIFHLATEKNFQSPLGARIKKLISDPAEWDSSPSQDIQHKVSMSITTPPMGIASPLQEYP